MLSLGLNLSGFNVLNYFSRNADNLLVGKFLGSVPLGFYSDGRHVDDVSESRTSPQVVGQDCISGVVEDAGRPRPLPRGIT